ncbi:MAG: hypothetical protein ABI277_04240 [Burkholderiaceae bacterium]
MRLLDRHASRARDAHHRPILAEAMHEQRRDAEIARVRRGTEKHGGAETATASMARDRQAEFGLSADRFASKRRDRRKVSCRRQSQVVVEHAEYRVRPEIDPIDVALDREIG